MAKRPPESSGDVSGFWESWPGLKNQAGPPAVTPPGRKAKSPVRARVPTDHGPFGGHGPARGLQKTEQGEESRSLSRWFVVTTSTFHVGLYG